VGHYAPLRYRGNSTRPTEGGLQYPPDDLAGTGPDEENRMSDGRSDLVDQ
jgi:hypothetical protein